MSPAESPHNSHLLFVGQQCHSPQCYMVDFLPLVCEHCRFAYCADHFRPAEHACDKFDAAKHDRVAPACPLCNTPVAIPPQQDPNVRMEQHIENECGKLAPPGSMPTCARMRCGKRLVAPIKCNNCHQQFCVTHRFPSAHDCSSAAAKPAAVSHAPSSGSKLVNKTSSASTAAIAAIKRNIKAPTKPSSPAAATSNATSITSSSSSTKKPASASKPANPFSKTDRCEPTSLSANETRTPMPVSSPLLPLPSSPENRCAPIDPFLPDSWVPPSVFA